MAAVQPFPCGARRVQRPVEVRSCPSCGESAGRGYPSCVLCTELVDQFWLLDWQALLEAERIVPGGGEERELAELVLLDDVGRHPWTCTDWAMTLLRCSACGGELGRGPRECLRCTLADEKRWAWDHRGHPLAMTGNEHALRVGRAVLRAPERHRRLVVQTWRLALPFLLVGEPVGAAQVRRVKSLLIAGRYDDLASCRSYAEMGALPYLPWRCGA